MDGLYLDPPERALMPCVNEKSQIQAWTALCYRYAEGKSSGIRTIISDMGQGRCKGASERTCRRSSPGRPLVIGCCGARWISVIDRAGTIDRGDLCTAGDAGDRLIRRSTSAWKMIARGKRGGISAHDKLSSAQVLP